MKYFLDTEFLEGEQEESDLLGTNRRTNALIISILFIIFGILCMYVSISIGILYIIIGIINIINYSIKDNWKTKPTIDLISIGIVAEDGREYYAISKDFNLKEAWNRYDLKPDIYNGGMKRVYWIRENVLKPIMIELQVQYNKETGKSLNGWNYKNFKFLINKYGKSNKQIAEEIKDFTKCNCQKGIQQAYDHYNSNGICINNPEFYAYYADYDWVVFCWLFGKMIDLPKGFPMYCIDLKQELDRIQKATPNVQRVAWNIIKEKGLVTEEAFKIKNHTNYPKQTNEHNALADAKWNYELYHFLNKL